ncbi:MAG: hypothetical protein WDN28_23205 [Chthoniobacter sp.]
MARSVSWGYSEDSITRAPLWGENEDAVRLEEEIAVGIGRIEWHELLSVGHEEPDRREVGMIHAGIHGKDELPAARLQPRRETIEPLERLASFVAVEEFEMLFADVDAADREGLARKFDGIELHCRSTLERGPPCPMPPP